MAFITEQATDKFCKIQKTLKIIVREGGSVGIEIFFATEITNTFAPNDAKNQKSNIYDYHNGMYIKYAIGLSSRKYKCFRK